MTNPCSISAGDLNSILLANRFSVEQGFETDGSLKVSAVDDMIASGANLRTAGGDKIECDGIDKLVLARHQFSFYANSFKKPGLWKAGIKSAYRRIPISPNQ